MLQKTETEKVKISYEFLKNRYFLISAGIIFFYLCAEATINGWLVKYFIDSRIMTIEYAQMLASLLWVVILVGRLTCAFLGDKVSKKTLLLTTSIGTAGFYFIITFFSKFNCYYHSYNGTWAFYGRYLSYNNFYYR